MIENLDVAARLRRIKQEAEHAEFELENGMDTRAALGAVEVMRDLLQSVRGRLIDEIAQGTD